jgi:mRNA interferase HigB
VNVISKRGLAKMTEAKRADRDTVTELDYWYKTARSAEWKNLVNVRQEFPSADQVGRVLIFNVRHNRYWLITFVVYEKQKVYVKALLSHKEYDRKEWMKWA